MGIGSARHRIPCRYRPPLDHLSLPHGVEAHEGRHRRPRQGRYRPRRARTDARALRGSSRGASNPWKRFSTRKHPSGGTDESPSLRWSKVHASPGADQTSHPGSLRRIRRPAGSGHRRIRTGVRLRSVAVSGGVPRGLVLGEPSGASTPARRLLLRLSQARGRSAAARRRGTETPGGLQRTEHRVRRADAPCSRPQRTRPAFQKSRAKGSRHRRVRRLRGISPQSGVPPDGARVASDFSWSKSLPAAGRDSVQQAEQSRGCQPSAATSAIVFSGSGRCV